MQAKEIITALLDQLWDDYRGRVSYAQRYATLVESKGGRVVNDHIALRTFDQPSGQPAGIEALARIFIPFGYKEAGSYDFPSKHLDAIHLEHEDDLLPKIFISTLKVDALPEETATIIKKTIASGKDQLSDEASAWLAHVAEEGSLPQDQAMQLIKNLKSLFSRPWDVPAREDIVSVNQDSQYAAWTLLHGNSVNHFTAYINKQQVAEWPDLRSTHDALEADGIPMKHNLEGSPESFLMQSATQAVDLPCEVKEADGTVGELQWSYAYYELAERFTDASGKLFQGFLGEQATHLFEMTARS